MIEKAAHPRPYKKARKLHAPQNEMLIKGELMAKAGNFYLKFGHQPEG
jgi:hypothetical protein